MVFVEKIRGHFLLIFLFFLSGSSFCTQDDMAVNHLGTDSEVFSPISGAVQMIFALALVIALAYLILHKGLGFLLKKQSKGEVIRVKERISLDNKNALYLVEIHNQTMVLSSSERGVDIVVPCLQNAEHLSERTNASFASVKKSLDTSGVQ